MLKYSKNFALFGLIASMSATAIILLPAGTAIAQEGAAGEIEEIVVTARKRAESLLEIPESVSVISGADIDRQNIKGLEEVGFQVPNLNLSTRLDGFANVSVRGLGAFGNTQGVGFYLDDVQLFSDASSRFGDLDRIEVLKGPQGTLYGGSNIGGAIKFVSARPDTESMFGRVKGVVGDQGIFDVEGSVNLPLGDGDWAMRAFGFWVTNDGYLHNPNPPRANGIAGDNDPDIGATEESGVRVSLAGPLGDNLTAYISVRSNEYEGPNNTWIRELDESNLQHPNEVPASFNPQHERNTASGMVELTWALDGYDITSVSSWTTTESFRFTDLDQKEEYLLSLFRPEDMDVLTQEIRFTSTDEGPFQWLGGVYYSRYDEKMDSDLVWYDTVIYSGGEISGPLGCAAGSLCSGVWAGETVTEAEELGDVALTQFEKRIRDKSHLAAFVNATYDLGEWELSLGLRGDHWNNDTTRFSTAHEANEGATEFMPRVSVMRWLDEGSMLYGTFSRGYEPGGFNVSEDVPDRLVPFDSEEAISYEGGWKGRLMDGRVSASLAAFYIDYDRRQIETQIPAADAGIVELINNVGDSKQFGFEVDLRMIVSDALSVGLSAGWIEAEWDSGTSVVTGANEDGSLILKDIGGDTPPVTPDFSWNLSADYMQPMSGAMNFIAGVQISHNGKYNGLRLSDPAGVGVVNPSFTLVGAQVGIAGDNWELALNVENLLDEDYYTDVQTFPDFFFLEGDADEIIVIGTLGQPQLITASFSYSF
jgi:iron complex outermembrane receptor protein